MTPPRAHRLEPAPRRHSSHVAAHHASSAPARTPALRAVIGVLALLAAGTLNAQSITGVVRDHASGAPVVGARVTLLADSTRRASVVISDAEGRFAFSPRRVGWYAIQAERIGFAPATSPAFSLAADSSTSVVIELVPVAQRLAEVGVMGSPERRLDFMRGFEQRRLRGHGSFLTRKDIQERGGATVMSQLLRGMMGMELMIDVDGNLIARSSRGDRTFDVTREGPCRASIYVDGVERIGEPLDRMAIPAEVEAIEFYSGAASLPIEFRHGDAGCGAAFIWTRSSAAAP